MSGGSEGRGAPTPPVVRAVTFATTKEKADYLDESAGLDSLHPRIARLGEAIAARHLDDLGALMAAYAFARDRVAYVRDPGLEEQFADSDAILSRGFDDCDGKSRVFVALVRAIRRAAPAAYAALEARIQPVHTGTEFTHVQAVARGRGTARHPKAMLGGWLLGEFIVAGAELGDGAEAGHADASGRIATN